MTKHNTKCQEYNQQYKKPKHIKKPKYINIFYNFYKTVSKKVNIFSKRAVACIILGGIGLAYGATLPEVDATFYHRNIGHKIFRTMFEYSNADIWGFSNFVNIPVNDIIGVAVCHTLTKDQKNIGLLFTAQYKNLNVGLVTTGVCSKNQDDNGLIMLLGMDFKLSSNIAAGVTTDFKDNVMLTARAMIKNATIYAKNPVNKINPMLGIGVAHDKGYVFQVAYDFEKTVIMAVSKEINIHDGTVFIPELHFIKNFGAGKGDRTNVQFWFSVIPK